MSNSQQSVCSAGWTIESFLIPCSSKELTVSPKRPQCLTHPPIQLVPEDFPAAIKRPKREAHLHLVPNSNITADLPS